MKAMTLTLAAAVAATWTLPSNVLGQVSLYAEAGPAIPTGDWAIPDGGGSGFGAQVGFQGAVGVDVPVGGGPFSLGARGFYAHLPYENNDISEQTSGLLGATLTATLAARSGAVAPFAYLELGLMRHSFESNLATDTSETGAVIGGGAGLRFPLGETPGGYLALRYTDSLKEYDYTQLFGISAGLRLSL